MMKRKIPPATVVAAACLLSILPQGCDDRDRELSDFRERLHAVSDSMRTEAEADCTRAEAFLRIIRAICRDSIDCPRREGETIEFPFDVLTEFPVANDGDYHEYIRADLPFGFAELSGSFEIEDSLLGSVMICPGREDACDMSYKYGYFTGDPDRWYLACTPSHDNLWSRTVTKGGVGVIGHSERYYRHCLEDPPVERVLFMHNTNYRDTGTYTNGTIAVEYDTYYYRIDPGADCPCSMIASIHWDPPREFQYGEGNPPVRKRGGGDDEWKIQALLRRWQRQNADR